MTKFGSRVFRHVRPYLGKISKNAPVSERNYKNSSVIFDILGRAQQSTPAESDWSDSAPCDSCSTADSPLRYSTMLASDCLDILAVHNFLKSKNLEFKTAKNFYFSKLFIGIFSELLFKVCKIVKLLLTKLKLKKLITSTCDLLNLFIQIQH